MATIEESECDPKSLACMFQEGLDLYNHLDTLTEPTNSLDFQTSVKKAMRILEDVTRLVSVTGMFSRNETVEEIATNNLQYLLLPALLGSLSLKLTSGDRNTIINVAEVYFKDFLERCNDYGLSNYEFKEKKQDKSESKSEFEQLRDSVNTRADKIQRFMQQKELKDKLENLKVNMKNENVDEDTKRAFFLTMIKLYIYESIDEISSIQMEKPILEHMAKLGKEEKPKSKRPPPPPLKPIIITKDDVQKAVFGAGYPSLPTMTVQEFYEKRVKDGIFPDPSKPKEAPMTLQEASLAGISLNDEEEKDAEQKENLTEEDDPEYIERMRARDEHKDDHRRGWGNRMNRS